MKKNYLFLLYCLLSFFTGFGQTTVQVGTETTDTSSSIPIYSYFEYNYSQQIVSANSYTTNGGGSGYITKIRYKISALGGNPSRYNNWTIYLGTTNRQQFANTADWVPLNQLTQVFSGIVNFTINGWTEITFTTPFPYGGQENLVVAVKESVPDYSLGFTVKSHDSGSNTGLYGYQDNNDINLNNLNSVVNKSLTNYTPILQFVFEPNNNLCFNISSASISNTVTSNSAAFTFNPATTTNIEYVFNESTTEPTIPGTVLNSGGTSLNFNNLSSNTNYYLHYRKECSPGVFSSWSRIDIRTLCSSFSIPFIETFNSNSPSLPCVSVINANNDEDTWVLYQTGAWNVTPQEGDQCAGIYTDFNGTGATSNNDYLITPLLDFTGIANLELKFYTKAQSTSEPNTLEVLLSTTGNTTADFNRVIRAASNVENTTWQEETYYFSTNGATSGYIAFRVPPNGHDGYYLYIDNVRIDVAPNCIDLETVTSGVVTHNSATFSWTPTLSSATATYSWELRTSGEPGSGAAGFVRSGTTGAGVTTTTINTLSSATEYYFYVRANCSSNDITSWTEAVNVTTLCSPPSVNNATADALCGIGSTTLRGTASAGSLYWYTSNAQGVMYAGVGNTFTTPEITQTTDFYVRAGQEVDNLQKIIGNGTVSSSSLGNSPFNGDYGGVKSQYIITAEELIAAGITAGNITKLGVEVVGTTPSDRPDFYLHIGATNLPVYRNTTFVPTANLTQVYNNPTYATTPGVNIVNFDTPFNWDGTSNIVIQYTWSNQNWSSVYTNVRSRAVSGRTLVLGSYFATAANMLTAATGTNYSAMPNFYINGRALCFSEPRTVTAVVTPSPVMDLSTSGFTICQGNQSQLITITQGAANYDQYEWVPSTGVSGNATTGWTITPQTTTTYRLYARQSNGSCSNYKDVVVNVTPMYYTTLPEEIIVCANDVKELKVHDTNPENPNEIILKTIDFEDQTSRGLIINDQSGVLTYQNNDPSGNYSLNVAYGDNANMKIIIDEIFAGGGNIQLSFNLKGETESYYDNLYVQYSSNNGGTWTNLASLNGNFNNASNPEQWSLRTYQVNATNLNNVIFRFLVTSDGSITRNFNIDNIIVKSSALTRTTTWAPYDNLYLDAEHTLPYNGENTGKVYFYGGNEIDAYPYTATIILGNNCTSQVNTNVIIPNIEFTGITDVYHCGTTAVEDLHFDAQPGVTYKWYTGMTSQTPITEIDRSDIYYVELISGNCTTGVRVPVNIKIVRDENVTVQRTQYFCDLATVADLVATPSETAGVVKWYASAQSTQPLAPDTVLVNGTTYYVTQTLGTCESQKIAVLVDVKDSPDPITENELVVCSNTTIINTNIGGITQLRFFVSQTATTPLSGQYVLTSGLYYVSVYNGICLSERVPVQVSVVENLSQPQVGVIDICGSGVVSDLNGYVQNVSPLATLKWYNSATSQQQLNPQQGLATGTYYVEQSISTCTSIRKAVAVRVNSLVAPVINNQQVCEGTKISAITFPAISGVTYNWYATPTSTTPLDPSQSLQTQTYYVKRVQNGCISDAARVNVTVLSDPNAPTGQSVQEMVQGSTIRNIAMDQVNIVWYNSYEDALLGRNSLVQNMPLVDGHTYYGVIYNAAGCPSEPTPVTINLFLGTINLDLAKLKVYPNPTFGELTVSYHEIIDKIEVFSILGQKVLDKSSNENEVNLDLTDLAAGTYMIKISVGNQTQLIKVLKK